MKRRVLLALVPGALAPLIATAGEAVRFNTREAGRKKAILHWGIDATWASRQNAETSVRNAGPEIDFVRVGFYMHEKLNDDGSLSTGQLRRLGQALDCAEIVGKEVPIMLTPHNEAGIIDWYKNADGSAHLDRWWQVMEKTRQQIESRGHKIVFVEVFNEPDFDKWKMGTRKDLDELCKRLKAWKIPRVGPSVMNTHWAETWYDGAHRNLEAGSTHTLHGTMEEFIDFAKEVKRDRRKFFCPESHSIAEVMAGAEAGADYVSWWGSIDEARGNFMRACQGMRLAYEAVEENWSAACVYRAPDGSLHAFVGATERENGKTTEYTFVCTNEDVTYFPDGGRSNGQFRNRGEGFEVQAKPPQGKRSQWIEIVPRNPPAGDGR